MIVARWYIFKPKYQFGYIRKGLAMEAVGLFYGQWAYVTAIWYILC
jgi:hypothetical protein